MTYKIDIKKILNEIDNKNYHYYNSLSDESKKDFNPYPLLRFTSNVNGDTDLLEWFILKTNECTNKNFWDLQKNHKELLWLLNCSIGAGITTYHPYIPAMKREKTDEIEKILENKYPTMKISDIKLLSQMMTDVEKKELLENNYHD
jgi:hypothetical protein